MAVILALDLTRLTVIRHRVPCKHYISFGYIRCTMPVKGEFADIHQLEVYSDCSNREATTFGCC